MNTIDHATLLGRTTSAAAEALYLASHSDGWLRNASATLLAHCAAELIVLEQHAGRPLSLQDAARFLAQGAEGRG